jgi:hypothetical protein
MSVVSKTKTSGKQVKVVIPQIKYTTNLNMFKISEVNRDFTTPRSQRRIKRIAQSMKEVGFLPTQPITISPTGLVSDGQHRLESAKSLGIGVYYMVDHTIKNSAASLFQAAVRQNEVQESWSKNDYIKGYVARGNKHYETLKSFMSEFPMFSMTECMMFLQNSGTRHCSKTTFAQGLFQVEDVDKGRQWATDILQLEPYFKDGYNSSVFVRTLLTIMEKEPNFSWENFIHKVKLRPSMIFRCGDKKSYSTMIEDLYNYRTREKLNLRLK